MTKITERKNAEAGRPSAAPPQEQMQKAYQVHTLAQMLYGQMAGAQPWFTYPGVQAGFLSAPPQGACAGYTAPVQQTGFPSLHSPGAFGGFAYPGMQAGLTPFAAHGSYVWPPAWNASPWGGLQSPVMTPFAYSEFGPFPR